MSYYGGYNDGDGAEDVFVKAAVEVKRFLPSLFNIKVVRYTTRSSKLRSRSLTMSICITVLANFVTLTNINHVFKRFI